jgi:hypothetical protein
VRHHFNTDPEAKALLERIKTYKKETLVLQKTTDENLRRLKATDQSTPVHAVFAPPASGDWKVRLCRSLFPLCAAMCGLL